MYLNFAKQFSEAASPTQWMKMLDKGLRHALCISALHDHEIKAGTSQ